MCRSTPETEQPQVLGAFFTAALLPLLNRVRLVSPVKSCRRRNVGKMEQLGKILSPEYEAFMAIACVLVPSIRFSVVLAFFNYL
jgi:hypothetical protein